MNSRSFSSDALKGCPNMQLSEGPFNGASVPENGTWRINKDSVSLSEPLPYIVALPMEEGVPQDVTVRPSSEALMYHNTSRPRSSNVVVRSSGEDLLSEVVSPLPQPMEKLHFTLPPPFLTKIYDLVEDVATNYTVSWSSGNNSFVVWNLSEFSQSLLPRYFKHNNFSSFVRQLNTYGFKKICSDRWEFAHKAFLRGQKHLLKDIHRRKPGTHVERQQELDSNLGAVAPLTEQCDERGNFGLREEIDCLKRDKSVLAGEVVRLQQQQQAAEHKTRAMAKHVQDAEKRQDLMMNFLAKAVQSPAFFAHLLQQSESRRAIYEARKRNCLPLGGEEVMTGLVMDQQAPVDTIKLPTVTDSEEKQGSYCDVEEYDVDSIEKHSKSDSAQIDLTSMNEVVQGPCGVTDSITSVGSGMVQSDGNIPLDYDLFLDNNSGPLHMSLIESTTDLDLVFDMQEFFEEPDLAVGDDVDTNPSSSNAFSCGTSDYNLYDKEVSQIIKGILGRDHSTAQQEVTFAVDCYLSHNVDVKDLLENDCMMGSV